MVYDNNIVSKYYYTFDCKNYSSFFMQIFGNIMLEIDFYVN